MKQSMILVLIVMALGIFFFFPRKEEEIYIEHSKEHIQLIRIDLTGEVDFPGVYHVFEPLTVSEALAYGGRIREDADLSQLNLSELITKDRQIIVSKIGKEENHPNVKINVNKASFKELITIPGMTETRAASLIIYRETYGDFKDLDELIHVKHIGAVTLEKIKPYLTL